MTVHREIIRGKDDGPTIARAVTSDPTAGALVHWLNAISCLC